MRGERFVGEGKKKKPSEGSQPVLLEFYDLYRPPLSGTKLLCAGTSVLYRVRYKALYNSQ